MRTRSKDENAEVVQARSQLTKHTRCGTVGWEVLDAPIAGQKVDNEGAKPRAMPRKCRDLFGKHRVGISRVNYLQIHAQIHHEM